MGEAYEYLAPKATTPSDYQTLQRDTFYGKEQAPLAYVVGLMNMILHGIAAPNYLRTDTLADRIAGFEEKGRQTRGSWCYQLDPGRNMGKTNPFNNGDLAEFVEMQKTSALNDQAWVVDGTKLDTYTYETYR